MQLKKLRRQIDQIDNQIVSLLSQRLVLVEKIAHLKTSIDLGIEDKEREKEVLENINKKAEKFNLSTKFIGKVFKLIIRESKRVEKNNL